MTWAAMTPDERLRAAREAISLGMSAGQTARKYGTTRNTVMGFAWRRCLHFRSGKGGALSHLRRRDAAPLADPAAAGPEALPLVKTRDLPRECRFPVGDWSVPVDDKLVCGRATVPGLSWCEGHLGVVADQTAKKRRQADQGAAA